MPYFLDLKLAQKMNIHINRKFHENEKNFFHDKHLCSCHRNKYTDLDIKEIINKSIGEVKDLTGLILSYIEYYNNPYEYTKEEKIIQWALFLNYENIENGLVTYEEVKDHAIRRVNLKIPDNFNYHFAPPGFIYRKYIGENIIEIIWHMMRLEEQRMIWNRYGTIEFFRWKQKKEYMASIWANVCKW